MLKFNFWASIFCYFADLLFLFCYISEITIIIIMTVIIIIIIINNNHSCRSRVVFFKDD